MSKYECFVVYWLISSTIEEVIDHIAWQSGQRPSPRVVKATATRLRNQGVSLGYEPHGISVLSEAEMGFLRSTLAREQS